MRRDKRNSNYYSRVYRYNYSYNNTSEAYELYTDYDYREENKGKHKKHSQLEKSSERMPVSMAMAVAGVVTVCALALGFVNTRAVVSAKRTEILYMTEQLEAINESNAYLENKLEETVDLKRVEEIAKTRLGMSKPRSYQIKYINVQKASYTEQYAAADTKKSSFAEVIANLFKE